METTKAQSRLLLLKQKLKEAKKKATNSRNTGNGSEGATSYNEKNVGSPGGNSVKTNLKKNKLQRQASTSLKASVTVQSKRSMKDDPKKTSDNLKNKKTEDKVRPSFMEKMKFLSKNKTKNESSVEIPSRKQKVVNKERSPKKDNKNKINETSKMLVSPDLSSKLTNEKSGSSSRSKNTVTEVQARNLFKRKKPDCNIPSKPLNSNIIESRNENFTNEIKSNEGVSARKRRLKDRGPLSETNTHEPLLDDFSEDRIEPRKVPLNRRQISEVRSLIRPSVLTKVIENPIQLNEEANDDKMEWEPYKVDILRNARTETCDHEELMMDWQEIMDISHSPSVNENSAEEKTVYFVVDTNVLIQNLFLVKKLITLPYLRGFKVFLMVPWQVLKELDKLKSNKDKSVGNCARKATRFLSENLGNKNKVLFQSQSMHLEDSPHVLVEVPDDHLIKCCCQLIELNKNVILLSNDVNLCVKSGAIGDIPGVPDKWLNDIILEDESKKPLRHHCFEIEPKGKISLTESNIPWFMYTLTQHLSTFLFRVICDYYKRKYNALWPLWITERKLPIMVMFSKLGELNLPETFKSDLIDHIWSFFKKKTTYEDLTAIDVEDFGRKCILSSQCMNLYDLEISIQFDQNMGFLKTGNLCENMFGYTLASSRIAQDFLKKMEDKIKSYLNYLEELTVKINLKRALIPDTSPIIFKIDKYLLVATKASAVFLLLKDSEDLPLSCPEIVIFHKILLDFLEIVQGNDRLPVFSPEDISNFINQKRDLNNGAVGWLTDVRNRLTEYKDFLGRLDLVT